MSDTENLKPGDVVAVFATFKKTGERYLFYGEVVDDLKIATAVKQGKDGAVSPKEQAFDSGKWEMGGVVKFASWDRTVLFKG